MISALKKTRQEPAEEVRRIELARLDTMLKAIWQQVLHGKPEAIDRAIKIASLRAKLLGLEAPTRHEHAATLTVIKDQDAYEQMWRDFYGMDRPAITVDADVSIPSGREEQSRLEGQSVATLPSPAAVDR